MDMLDLAVLLRQVVAERVRDGRLTQLELSRLSGVSQPQLANWLGGRRRLSVVLQCEVMAACGLEISDLVSRYPGGDG
jgi:transcriptional regulator with XRE-family HTH domain